MNFINIKKLFLLLSFISFTAIAATAQVVVRGKVVDKSGKGMQGVSVSVLDADGRIVSGASTDIEGNFVIKNVNTKNRISVSNIGYKSITQSIGTRTSFNFTLEDAQSDLGEVVVVARP